MERQLHREASTPGIGGAVLFAEDAARDDPVALDPGLVGVQQRAYAPRDAAVKEGEVIAPGSTAARVRRLVSEELPIGEASLLALSAKLRVSPRTLQRRLRDEGTSLHAEVDQARRERAAALLDNGAAIAEIVWLLGYSEPSAFHRAFKRWTGRTPEAWRAERGIHG